MAINFVDSVVEEKVKFPSLNLYDLKLTGDKNER